MWTDTTREKHARSGLRYSSDLTDAEWGILEPELPAPSRLGRPRKWSPREIMNAILYLLRGGLPWRMAPKDFPPVSTVQHYFHAWRDAGVWDRINHLLDTSINPMISGFEAGAVAFREAERSIETR
jgi:transposase